MAKSGLRSNIPANGKKDINAADLKKQMRMQAAPLKAQAFGASLKINSDGPGNRKFEMIIINGVEVKRFID